MLPNLQAPFDTSSPYICRKRRNFVKTGGHLRKNVSSGKCHFVRIAINFLLHEIGNECQQSTVQSIEQPPISSRRTWQQYYLLVILKHTLILYCLDASSKLKFALLSWDDWKYACICSA
jgi:hypothetical protein